MDTPILINKSKLIDTLNDILVDAELAGVSKETLEHMKDMFRTVVNFPKEER